MNIMYVIKKVNKHIKHINSYDTEINYYSKKSLNKKDYYNFYNDNLNFRKIEHISLSQQTNITNNITETNTQTINYVDNNYLNNNKIAAVIVNPTPSLNEDYLWIPEGIIDNVVPGLDRLLTCTHSKYATLTSLQNSITNINSTIINEIQNIQTETNNIEINNPTPGNVSKNLSYHTSHTDSMYQRNTTNDDNRRQFVIQNHYFTYQRKGTHELQIQASNIIVADLQNQINNLSSGGGGGGEDPDISTMSIIFKSLIIFDFLYIPTCGCEYLYISPEIIKPVPNAFFKKNDPPKHKNNIKNKQTWCSLTETQGFEKRQKKETVIFYEFICLTNLLTNI